MVRDAVISVFDIDSGRECPFGEIGMLYFQARSRMKEYFLNPKATNEFFIEDNTGEKWGVTGDIGYVTADGQVVVKCRAKERFTNEKNESCFPYQIEDALYDLEEVRRCKVISTAYEGKPVMAVHISLKTDIADKQALAERMQGILRQNKEIRLLPKLFKFRESFPINQAGKTDMLGMAAETDGFIVMPDQAV